MSELRIDHVTVAGSDLDALRRRLAAAGLATAYGGAHSNGITHMAATPLADGSYLEAISTLEPGREGAPLWGAQIAADAGACAWALRCDDLEAELARLAALGIAVRGPEPLDRRRPDGVELRWRLGFVGAGAPGSLLPFLIEDQTPRQLRVEPPPGDRLEPEGETIELVAVERVVLGVESAAAAVSELRRAYGLVAVPPVSWPELAARVTVFPGAPVAVAEPEGAGGWLARRLARFGPSPCAFVFRAGSAAGKPARGDERPRWLAPELLGDLRLGVVEG